MWIVHRIRDTHAVNRTFRGLQLVSAAAFSLGHGANDAQKTMGIIAALLIGADKLDAACSTIPTGCRCGSCCPATARSRWARCSAAGASCKTMGTKLTRLQPMGGVCAESAAAATLFFASFNGIPVSTTHTITGAIVGVGSAERMSAVRWSIARRVVWAWVLTIPGSAAVAMLTFWIVEVFN